MPSSMKDLETRRHALDGTSGAMIGESIASIHYNHLVEGFINIRDLRITDFEYAPLSVVYLRMASGRIFKIFDDMSFLDTAGYTTLNLAETNKTTFGEADQSAYELWLSYLNSPIRKSKIEWSVLPPKYSSRISYPRSLSLEFQSGRELIIVAADLHVADRNERHQLTYTCPDEALLLFFSRAAFERSLKE